MRYRAYVEGRDPAGRFYDVASPKNAAMSIAVAYANSPRETLTIVVVDKDGNHTKWQADCKGGRVEDLRCLKG